jgi:hypothetical protein
MTNDIIMLIWVKTHTEVGNYFISSSIFIVTVPLFLLEAISIKAFFDKSISRPLINGPRSVTSTITDFPLASLVTLSFVPKGNFLWAAVYFELSKFFPLAVFLPLNLSA